MLDNTPIGVDLTCTTPGKVLFMAQGVDLRVGYTQAKAAMYVRVNTLGISGGGNNVTEYIGDGNTSIFPKNNVTLPNDLQQLVEASYKKSELTGEEYINKVEEDITDFTSEDRVLFCIMQS